MWITFLKLSKEIVKTFDFFKFNFYFKKCLILPSQHDIKITINKKNT